MDLLKEAREEINQVDKEMAKLFVRRMDAVAKVAKYKQEHGLPVFDGAREAQVIQKNAELVEDDELRAYYVNYIQNNMTISRAYQHKLLEGMKIAYCGTEGAFAHIATGKLFPTSKRIAYKDFEAAYRAVEAGECDAAVLPVENSYNGEVGQVTDLMFSGNLYVNSLLELAVTQDLLVVSGTKLEDIKEVISHPQALGQCAQYIRDHGWVQHEYSNTALAAKYVAGNADKSVAAIASKEAAELFGLEVLATNINSSRNNTTRFAVFSRSKNEQKQSSAVDISILMFTVKNEAGSLAKAIDVIGRYGFNMRCLRSRPMKELMWQYYFYVEAEGCFHSPAGDAMMRDLSIFCDRLKMVGTYSKG